MEIDTEMTQLLEVADKYFKEGIVSMLNKRQYAHNKRTNIINLNK